MISYGNKKTYTLVKGHQECSTCHPEQKNKKKRERNKIKLEIEYEMLSSKDDCDCSCCQALNENL